MTIIGQNKPTVIATDLTLQQLHQVMNEPPTTLPNIGISELLACPQFEEEDREAIGRVTMLLVEYAWSNDRMSDNSKKLKAAMLKVWEHWQARQADGGTENL